MATLMIDNINFSLLSQGENGQVVELSTTEVAKVFDLGATKKEAALMKAANKINSLVVGFRRVEFTPEYSKELLVMERLYPLQYRALTVKKREEYFDVFLSQLRQLHERGFAHGDIKRPEWVRSLWDNIILTQEGLRLIDCGSSATPKDFYFEGWCERDVGDAMEFREVFLTP